MEINKRQSLVAALPFVYGLRMITQYPPLTPSTKPTLLPEFLQYLRPCILLLQQNACSAPPEKITIIKRF